MKAWYGNKIESSNLRTEKKRRDRNSARVLERVKAREGRKERARTARASIANGGRSGSSECSHCLPVKIEIYENRRSSELACLEACQWCDEAPQKNLCRAARRSLSDPFTAGWHLHVAAASWPSTRLTANGSFYCEIVRWGPRSIIVPELFRAISGIGTVLLLE